MKYFTLSLALFVLSGCLDDLPGKAVDAPAPTALVSAAPRPPDPSPPFTANELKYLPVLRKEIAIHWPDAPRKAVFGAQVRKETCAGLKSKKCWSPTAELKTDREYGFGLGQLTVTAKFDNFKEAKKLDSTMAAWQWENRYDPSFQLRTLLLMDRGNYNRFSWATGTTERLAFTIAAYNGGIGGVLSDRTVCKATAGCDPNIWFGHVEHTSKKAKVPVSGYGQSFFQINRGYARDVVLVYPERYLILDTDFEIDFKKETR